MNEYLKENSQNVIAEEMFYSSLNWACKHLLFDVFGKYAG